MKNLFSLVMLILANCLFSQIKIATTEDGKRVLLKEDSTWQYLDASDQTSSKKIDSKCDLDASFVEPKPDKSVQSFLKRVDATIEDLRKHIAVENDCQLNEIIFMNISEQKGNGMYSVCVKGRKMKYRRIGSSFLKADEDPFPDKK